MLRELRNHVPSTVTIVRAAFEDLTPSASYDLVFAAAAMHWTDPVGRWERVADPALEAAVHEARRPFLESDSFPSPDGTPAGSEMQWPATELALCGLFSDVRQTLIDRRTTVSARDYVGHLSTVSAYLELPSSVRADAFSRILQVLPEPVEVADDIVLHLARRAA